MLKRLVDILGASVGLIIFSPVMLVVAILIRLYMGSPVIFSQLRPGLDGRPFKMLKFRTMLNAMGPNGSPLPDHARLTRLGRVLRSTSIDELPELYNVLRGEMSLVGPRPLLMEYLPYYSAAEMSRHNVRPGITGLSQINGRNTSDWDSRLSLDVDYVANRTIWLDLRIVYKTIINTMRRRDVLVDPRSVMQDLDVYRKGYVNVRFLQTYEAADAGNLISKSFKDYRYRFTILGSGGFSAFLEDSLIYQDCFIGAFREDSIIAVLQIKLLNNLVWHINSIAVAADERGRGIARLLISNLIELKKDHEIDLFVDSENRTAINIYKHYGFTEHSYEDFIIMDIIGRKEKFLPVAEINGFGVVDNNSVERYGFGYLNLDGGPELIGYFEPNRIKIPDDRSREIFQRVLNMGVECECQAPRSIENIIPPGLKVATARRIKMVRKPVP